MTEAAGRNRFTHLAQNVTVVSLVLVAILAFLAGWHLAKHQDATSQKAANTSNLQQVYKNQQYGFQLMYPQDWSSPTTTVSTINTDKHYIVRFEKGATNGKSFNITLWMDYSDPKNNVCNASKQCFDPSAVTKANILDTIKNGKAQLAASDSSSYAIVNNPAGQNISSLAAGQIVDLNKLNITAATLTYQVSGVSGCSQNKFAASASNGCITRSDYATVNQVLKSLKNL